MVRPHLKPIVIAGPTASGKSALAMHLAKKFKGEIICADSRQFYSHMEIGTACPSKNEKILVNHHGFSLVDPKEKKIDLGFFYDFAQQKIKEIQAKNLRPILVGGTGMYLRGLRFGVQDVPRSDPNVRAQLDKECDQLGSEILHDKLKTIDPLTAKTVDPNDRFRIVRALEIFRLTKKAPSTLRKSFSEQKNNFHAHFFFLDSDRKWLWQRLESRVEKMFANGLIEETKLLKKHVGENHWALDVMGYKETLDFIDQKISLDEAKEKIFFRHRQYAKRQLIWFKKENYFKHLDAKTIAERLSHKK